MKTVQQKYRKRNEGTLPAQVLAIEYDEKPASKNFDELLLKAVDESLALLGNSAKKAIYFHLEQCYGIGKFNIPKKTNDFSSAIEKILGEGAKLIELQIMKQLHEKVGNCRFHLEGDYLSFPEYILAHKAFLASSPEE